MNFPPTITRIAMPLFPVVVCCMLSLAYAEEPQVAATDTETFTPQGTADTVTQSTDPVEVSCGESRDCWLQLAKTLQMHPNARHISVQYYREWSESALSLHYTASQKIKLFFNSRYETVDSAEKQVHHEFGGDFRAHYNRVSKSLLLKFMAQGMDLTREGQFDDFARRNGVEMYRTEYDYDKAMKYGRKFRRIF